MLGMLAAAEENRMEATGYAKYIPNVIRYVHVQSDRVINPYAKDYPISDSGRDSGYGGRQPDIRSRTESPAAAKQPFKWDKWVCPVH